MAWGWVVEKAEALVLMEKIKKCKSFLHFCLTSLQDFGIKRYGKQGDSVRKAPTTETEIVGRKFRFLREVNNISQENMAEGLGVTRPTLSAYENGKGIDRTLILAYERIFWKDLTKIPDDCYRYGESQWVNNGLIEKYHKADITEHGNMVRKLAFLQYGFEPRVEEG